MTSVQNSGTTPREAGPSGSRPYVPAHPTVAIDDVDLRERYEKFELGARKIRWDDAGPVRIDWSAFDRSRLTLDNLLVVKLVTFVESYADVYTTLLLDNFCTNDTMATFFQLWEREEQNHADKLVAYLKLVGLDEKELHESLQRPRLKQFSVPYIKTPLQASAFTYCQELLTAFFYQMFRRTVSEPLLNEILTKIIADEWRHFHWYEYVVSMHLKADRKKTLEEVLPVFEHFAMPGNQILGAEYEILTDEIIKRMRFSTSEIFQIGKTVTGTFGLIEGGRLIARSSYARGMKDVVLHRKPPHPQHDQIVRSFTVDLEKALTAGTA
ncbi:MAG TPA: acyl-ACP desaturase [Candidatus Polarisedimenticolia bacterium]|nr:acyl-ACP desaturase [Candidatus Polarisedimenticolia bacterium]